MSKGKGKTWRFFLGMMTAMSLLFYPGWAQGQTGSTSVEDAVKAQGAAQGSVQGKSTAAQSQAASPSTTAVGKATFWGSLLQLLFTLFLLAGLIYFLIRFLAMRRGNLQVLGMRTLGVYPLNANRSIHVVAMEDRILILGVGNNVTLLQVIDDPQQVEHWLAQGQDLPKTSSFLSSWLPWSRRINGRRENQADFDAMLTETLAEMKEQRRQLERWDEDQS